MEARDTLRALRARFPDVVRAMLGSTNLANPGRIGIYWEADGLGNGDTMDNDRAAGSRLASAGSLRPAAATPPLAVRSLSATILMTIRPPQQAYWKRNLSYVAILLAIWFVVSYGFGILLVEPLNRIRIGGFQLGVWFAQQGSIYVFVVLIFAYVRLMNRLDREFDVDERDRGPA